MKTKFALYVLVAVSLFSCKETKENSPKEQPQEVNNKVENKNSLTLSNYSDKNWKNGIGITYNMLLIDNSKNNEELLKGRKELELPDGSVIPYIGYKIVGDFIQIQLNENASKYAAAAEYPNVIIVK